jgi:hypothetical protein
MALHRSFDISVLLFVDCRFGVAEAPDTGTDGYGERYLEPGRSIRTAWASRPAARNRKMRQTCRGAPDRRYVRAAHVVRATTS